MLIFTRSSLLVFKLNTNLIQQLSQTVVRSRYHPAM